MRRDVAKRVMPDRIIPATEFRRRGVCPSVRAVTQGPGDVEKDIKMTMNTKRMWGGAALGAVLLAGLTTVALADRGDTMGFGGDGAFLRFDFAAIDADRDGKITRAELEAHRTARVAAVDADKDGKLSAAELKAQAMERAGTRADEMAARMIERHDSDGDGLISAAELAAGPAPMDIFDRIDADKDGAISADEAEAARKFMARRMGRHHDRGGAEKGPQD